MICKSEKDTEEANIYNNLTDMPIIRYYTEQKIRLQHIYDLQKSIMMFIHIFHIFNVVCNLNVKSLLFKGFELGNFNYRDLWSTFITMLNIGDMPCIK